MDVVSHTPSSLGSAGRTDSVLEILAIMSNALPSFPHMLVLAVGDILLPIIPHIDDYECAICTSIAFKPIRLACSHLFCVRYVPDYDLYPDLLNSHIRTAV